MMGLFQDLIALQREIHLAFADRIGTFAQIGDWCRLALKRKNAAVLSGLGS